MLAISQNMPSLSKLESLKRFELQHNKATHFPRNQARDVYSFASNQDTVHSCPLISTGLCDFGSRHQIKWEN